MTEHLLSRSRSIRQPRFAAILMISVFLSGSLPFAAAAESDGLVSLSLDGEEKRFDFLPSDGNYYTSMASNIRIYADDGSTESLYITLMSIDLKSLELPVDLPLPRDPKNPFATLASVGFGYINAEGVEWAGPGNVTIESFNDGVLAGRFDNVSIPHTDKSLPAVELDAGSFKVRLEK